MSQTSDKCVAKLNGSTASGNDDNRNDYGSGTKKEWDISLAGVSATVQVDQTVAGLHIEAFEVSGQWKSHVRYDNFFLGGLIDKIWGDDKHPYGTFKLNIKSVDGGITSDVRVDVDGVDDEPNRYGREHADGLIRSILQHIQES